MHGIETCCPLLYFCPRVPTILHHDNSCYYNCFRHDVIPLALTDVQLYY